MAACARRRASARVWALLACAALAGGCARARAAGVYTRADEPSQTLRLDADGSLTLREPGVTLSGRWRIEDDRVTLEPLGRPAWQARLAGRALVRDDGQQWLRKWPAGHYAHPRVAGYFVDLKPDGSFRYSRGPHDHRGRYEVEGSLVTLYYPADGRCSRSDGGPAVPSPGLCAFRAEVRAGRLTFFKWAGTPGQSSREDGEELLLRAVEPE